MELYRDIDDGIKSAWTVDLVELHTDSGPAGYLKISYVPKELAETYFPDAFAYSVWELGRHNWQLRAQLLQPQEEWSREQLLEAFHWTDGFRTADDELAWRENAADQELLEAWETRRRELGEEASVEYERFKDFHVDKPLIDYVRVSSGQYDQHYQDGKRVQDHADMADHRRQGLATVMYETAAIWMRTRGMKLHASGVQSDDAVGVWKKFEERGLIEEDIQQQADPKGARAASAKPKARCVFAADQLLRDDPDLDFQPLSTQQ